MKNNAYLRIPFKLNEESKLQITEENNNFKIEDYCVLVNVNNDAHVGYFDIIVIGDDLDELYKFYVNFKNSLHLLNLTRQYWSIKLDEIKRNELAEYIFLKKPQITDNKIKTIKKGNRYEAVMQLNLKMDIDVKVEVTEFFPISDMGIELLNFYKHIKDDKFTKKQKTAIDLYADSYYKEGMSRFLIYVVILEVLKPKIKRRGITKKCCDDLKQVVKDYRNENDDAAIEIEFAEIRGNLNYIDERSISYSVKSLANTYKIELEGYEDISEIIGETYRVRSKFVHDGVIKDTFEVCLEFLDNFIPVLLKEVVQIQLNEEI